MSNKTVAAIAAAALTVGMLVGAAGAIVVGDVTSPDPTGRGMWGQTMPMMGGPMMGGPMMGEADLGDMAALHAQHHGTTR